MIVHEGPGNDSGPGRCPHLADSRQKLLTVFVIPEDIRSLYAANHHMMKRSGCIQSRLSWHGYILSRSTAIVNEFLNTVNYVPFAVFCAKKAGPFSILPSSFPIHCFREAEIL